MSISQSNIFMYPLAVTASSAEELVKTQHPNYPILCMSQQIINEQVQLFIKGFPGKVLYAVKCNPDSNVVQCVLESGISNFDVASLSEILLINKLSPTSYLHFNHPVKDSISIKKAYQELKIKDYVIDSQGELDKVLAVTDKTDITIQLRLKVPPGSDIYDFSTKFGLTVEDAIALAEYLSRSNIRWALSFHVGSQCEVPKAYVKALRLCHQVMMAVDSKPNYINVGGGFPAYVGLRNIKPLTSFFDAIRDTVSQLVLPPLLCEPGRAIVSSAGKLITRIVLRDGARLFLNDGVFGAFGETNYGGFKPIARAIRPTGLIMGELSEFRIFGPTCDSYDALKQSLALPTGVQTGDWLIFDNMGAYSTALASQFNGFSGPSVIVTD